MASPYVYANPLHTLIKRRDNEGGVFPVDEENIDYVAFLRTNTYVDPYEPPKPPPISVTRAQGLMALYNAGLLDQVEEKLAAHPYPPVRIWFNNALKWERDHIYINAIAMELGLTEKQIDDLFTAALLLTA